MASKLTLALEEDKPKFKKAAAQLLYTYSYSNFPFAKCAP
jgi:hypothetical protein